MRFSFIIFFLGGWMTEQNWMSRGQGVPKPSISVSPSDMVILRGNVNIHCRNEKVAQAEFALLREGRAILFRAAELHEVVFSLASVKKADTGVYWCKCQIRNDSADRWSPNSDLVHINVIDPSLTKPFIKVSPRGKLAVGSNVTIECQSKETGLTFSLRKSGKQITPQKTEPHGNTTKFLLSVGRTEDAGSYICQYQQRENPFVWSEPSDPVELVVTAISSTEIFARLGAAGFVLLALGLIVAEAAYSWRKGEL
ncbi:UNVERIFIED_CONTAM: hypothetical protein K2H54_038548 [Gekko kuhli]